MSFLWRRLFSVAPLCGDSMRKICLPASTYSLQLAQKRTIHFPKINLPTVSQRLFASAQPLQQKKTVAVHFMRTSGDKHTVQAKVGDNLLDVIIDNDVDLDGFGACEGTLACSTCHLVFKPEHYDKIEDKPTDEELDMLDLAYGLEDTSRLGCQVIVTPEMDGWEILVPEGVSDAREP